MRGVGRPERKLDPSKPLHAFAAELRELRARAGSPKYLTMARETDVSQGALQNAAGGDHLPTWRTVEAYVKACGGDPDDWRPRWERLQQQLKAEAEAANDNGHRNGGPTQGAAPESVSSPSRRRWLVAIGAALLVALTATAVRMTDVLMSPVGASRKATDLPATVAAIIVQNKVALGADALTEDTTPAYLSSRPVPYCSRNGCVVSGTTLSSDTAVIADCQATGAMMYNYNLDSPLALTNPNRAASKLWYHIVLRSAAIGYLSEVYIEPQYRGGLGLPVCKR